MVNRFLEAARVDRRGLGVIDRGGPWQLQLSVTDGGDAIFEGDIVLGPFEAMAAPLQRLRAALAALELETLRPGEDVSQAVFNALRTAKAGLLPAGALEGMYRPGAQYRWDGGRIPYRIVDGCAARGQIAAAIDHWNTHTRLRLVPHAGEDDVVEFRGADFCGSPVGRIGGAQPIYVAPACEPGNMIHEIGHTVGLWHEQSRFDRDRYVDIRWDNISWSYVSNFDQPRTDDGVDHGPYDYASIMHYPDWAFARDEALPTIVPKQPGVAIGQRAGLSDGDIAAVHAMYGL